jgi:hypothetical protein
MSNSPYFLSPVKIFFSFLFSAGILIIQSPSALAPKSDFGRDRKKQGQRCAQAVKKCSFLVVADSVTRLMTDVKVGSLEAPTATVILNGGNAGIRSGVKSRLSLS